MISKGEFGRVYHATRLSDGTVFALKQVDLEGMNRLEVSPFRDCAARGLAPKRARPVDKISRRPGAPAAPLSAAGGGHR